MQINVLITLQENIQMRQIKIYSQIIVYFVMFLGTSMLNVEKNIPLHLNLVVEQMLLDMQRKGMTQECFVV